MPKPKMGEARDEFMRRWMTSEHAKKKFPTRAQRIAVGLDYWRRGGK